MWGEPPIKDQLEEANKQISGFKLWNEAQEIEIAQLRKALKSVKSIIVNEEDYSLVVDTGEVIIEIIDKAINNKV